VWKDVDMSNIGPGPPSKLSHWVAELKEFCLDATAGTIGGVIGVLVGNPFDVVKTRMQAGTVAYKGSADCIRHVLKVEGASAFYKGSLVASLGQAPNNFLTFGHYGLALRALDKYFPSPSSSASDHRQRPLWHVYVAGSWAGAAQSIALAPFEHIKVQQQLMGEAVGSKPLGLMEAIRHIYTARGFSRGLMRGWVATAWRDIPTFGLYFTSFEMTKLWYERTERSRRRSQALQAGWSPEAVNAEERRPVAHPEWVLLAGGGLAGIVSWSLAIPSDVIKSNIQGSPITTDPKELRFLTVARRLYQQGGRAAFFRGFAACLTRSVPVNAVTFAVYELSLKEFKDVFGSTDLMR
jgi:solute carrier family 25 carnitine/acylcarnitine transporter 20/29